MEMGNLCDLSIVYRIRLHFVRHNGSRNEVHLFTCSNITLARLSFFVVVVDVTFQCTSIYISEHSAKTSNNSYNHYHE